jgi:hypothetical protein
MTQESDATCTAQSARPLKNSTLSPKVGEALIAEIKPSISVTNINLDDSSGSLPDIAEAAPNYTTIQPYSLKAESDCSSFHHQPPAGANKASLNPH